MSYKTILVHVDDTRHNSPCIAVAANIAMTENAHLIGTAMTGVSRFLYPDQKVDEEDPNFAPHLQFLRQRAGQVLSSFEQQMHKIGVSSYEKSVLDDEAGSGICLQARYCDLVIIEQADPNQTVSAGLAHLPEYVILHSARPVLLIPHAGQFDRLGEKILIAWDGSRQATRTVTDAIPFLQRARIVYVAVFNAGAKAGMHGEQPGADIALYLARHGIKISVLEQKTVLNIGTALLMLVRDLDCDLCVMGGYGHSRLREKMLGGVTRTMLKNMTTPVLMSH